ncbi:MAG: NAD(P)-dependent oxidoreductase, partial [Pseudonocardiaceae bacterium]
MKPYLVGLDLTGRRVVVVGAGTVAGRRLPRLIAVGADVLLIAPEATPAVEAMATAGELRWEVRGYTDGDLESAWYALACSSEPAVNAAVAEEARRRRVFCVRADDATGGSAVTAATGEHEGLLIGVLAGRRPRRSAAVRDALVDALRAGVVDDAPDAEERITTPGVALVGAGPGDPDLITVRGRRLLARADVVLADRLAPRELLDELGAHVTVIDAAKVPYGRAMAQEQINAQLIEHARA